MSANHCPDCKFAFRADLAGPYQCRRNPPTVTAFMVPGRLQGQAQIMTNASFPPVDANTWCGEFSAKGSVNSIAFTIPEQPQAPYVLD
jgi:hypothetical protein